MSRKILVVSKARHAVARDLALKIQNCLTEWGHQCIHLEAGQDPQKYRQNYDLAVILGGDGTILEVARSLVASSIPLLGINFGRMGFLTHCQPTQWQETLWACLHGELSAQPRLALQWQIVRKNVIRAQGVAINDIVLSHGSIARLVHLDLAINGQKMGLLRSDGVIISSAMGSSGYALSAGGPLLYSSMEAIILTPICPFPHPIAPLVCPADFVFTLQIRVGSTTSYLTTDGQQDQALLAEDLIKISGLPRAVSFFDTESAFLTRLKMRIFANATQE